MIGQSQNRALDIAVVTGSRADYGLLLPVIKALDYEPTFKLNLWVTGTHLDPAFGETIKQIEADHFSISATIDVKIKEDGPTAISKAIARGISGFADVISIENPDLIIVLGDRYEIFSAVQAALIANIPVAHIAGGDSTEGAFDEAIRHSISKMSHIHFTTHEQAKQRVLQLGENPQQVFNVGSPGIDNLMSTSRLSREQLANQLDIVFRKYNFVITLHPTTLDSMSVNDQFDRLIQSLEAISTEASFIFTYANADTHGKSINTLIDDYVAHREYAYAFPSLGQQRYYSLVTECDAVIGNSSSGFYEAPSLGTATVNIGDRQTGRYKPDSVIQSNWDINHIIGAINHAITFDMRTVVNPYGDGKSSQRILETLKIFANREKLQSLLKKHFFIYSGVDL